MVKKRIGNAIKEARETKGLSQRKLAKLADINSSELSKIESGKRKNPAPYILRKISRYIDLNYNEMMYLIDLSFEFSPLNPFIKEYYVSLKGEELDGAWIMAQSSIENNNLMINYLKEQINNYNLKQNDKDKILDTIEDLEYQNATNRLITCILDTAKYQERRKYYGELFSKSCFRK